VPEESKPVWYVEIRRDEEKGPTFYRVHIRDAEADPELSKARHVTDVKAVRTMLFNFRDVEISAKVMFGGVDVVDRERAVDLLTNETGTRLVAKVKASRPELLSSLALLKV
jgi:hypothetical protein